jgi:hypothetical protein
MTKITLRNPQNWLHYRGEREIHSRAPHSIGENVQKKKKEYRYSLHGDIKIHTRSNRQPAKAIGYAWEPVRSGGRVWRLHKNKRKSWLCDTVMLETAQRMAEELDATCHD